MVRQLTAAPAYELCGLRDPEILHWATALGLTACPDGRQFDLRQRGCLLLLATQMTSGCFPKALEAARRNMHTDDHCFLKLKNFASSQNIK